MGRNSHDHRPTIQAHISLRSYNYVVVLKEKPATQRWKHWSTTIENAQKKTANKRNKWKNELEYLHVEFISIKFSLFFSSFFYLFFLLLFLIHRQCNSFFSCFRTCGSENHNHLAASNHRLCAAFCVLSTLCVLAGRSIGLTFYSYFIHCSDTVKSWIKHEHINHRTKERKLKEKKNCVSIFRVKSINHQMRH